MIKIKEAVIVEGKYDKIKLSSLIDGLIIETRGFRIFQDKEQMDFIRKMARERGLLILTDSDSAGFLIRNYLSGAIPKEQIKHAYIPDLFGKEKRKSEFSREGKLGVEGMPSKVLVQVLERAGVTCLDNDKKSEKKGKTVTKTDFYLLGFSGQENSVHKRTELLKHLGLPEHLSVNSLLKVINDQMTYEEFCSLAERIVKDKGT